MQRSDDQGFTLIELMVIVLIIAILLAVAIPTFLGAKERAERRSAQSNVRNGVTNALVYFADKAEFTASPLLMSDIDGAFTYTNSLADLDPERELYISVGTLDSPNDTLYVAAEATNGKCYWMRIYGNEPVPRFAVDPGCTGLGLVFEDRWA